jgi:hypothetical protein
MYRHTQLGTVTFVAIGAGVLMCAVLFRLIGPMPAGAMVILWAVLIMLVAALVLFATLTVEVTRDAVALWFGPGVVRKRFLLRDIASARPVRNRWYYGWGIRFTPHGWLYNVSGLGAVELQMRTGKRYRIGTDEPAALAAAVEAAITASR